MGIFTQQVFIPRLLYSFMPLIYLLTGISLWLVFTHALIKLIALALIAFAVYITFKRFSKPAPRARSRSRQRSVRYR